ncbi:hypothetical protein MKX01_005159 [Papaver californicum]|nr:hypothetical protein MKX01_005159 [Papaver californicum]
MWRRYYRILGKFSSDIKIRGTVAVGLNPNIKLYRSIMYKIGSDLHVILMKVGRRDCFYGPRKDVVLEVAPTEGMALLHLHGDNCVLHEAHNVAKDVKYVFCSDVIFALWSSESLPFSYFMGSHSCYQSVYNHPLCLTVIS